LERYLEERRALSHNVAGSWSPGLRSYPGSMAVPLSTLKGLPQSHMYRSSKATPCFSRRTHPEKKTGSKKTLDNDWAMETTPMGLIAVDTIPGVASQPRAGRVHPLRGLPEDFCLTPAAPADIFLPLTKVNSRRSFPQSYREWQRDWPCEATATAGSGRLSDARGNFRAQVPNPAPDPDESRAPGKR